MDGRWGAKKQTNQKVFSGEIGNWCRSVFVHWFVYIKNT